jgi:O-antigen biosynthesis protein
VSNLKDRDFYDKDYYLNQEIEIKALQNRIKAMESSKFWKLRNIWFGLKNYVGISDEQNLSLFGIANMAVWQLSGNKLSLTQIKNKTQGKGSYEKWLSKNTLTSDDISNITKEINKFKILPKFSIITPVYNVDAKWLEKAIISILNQVYTNWEMCIADDASTKPHIRQILTKYAEADSRIKVVFLSENKNISAASNSALELATGDYIALLDHDDELSIDALYENAKLIDLYPDADFIYSDEDKINKNGKRCDPFFKPNWSPDYFHSCMYTCHLGVYRTSLIRDIGGFRSEYDGSQDYDLVLRVAEKTKQIYHIPKILYHWRIIPSSVTSGAQAKPWAYVAAQKALEDMLGRSSYPGCVEQTNHAGFWRVRRNIIGQPLVSIIIPSAGKMCESGLLSHLEKCIASIQTFTQYRNFEIVIVDGFDINEIIIKNISAPNLRLVRCVEPFNFSMRINKGVDIAKGEFILILNDDTEVINHDWIESMLEFAQQTEVGAVGAKLLFPNGNLQHTGVIILGVSPGHSFYNSAGTHPGYFCSNIVNRNYLAVTGACLMMRRSVFIEVGGLDENFPLNYNDVDLCLKVHQAGYRNIFTPYARLIHYESASREGVVKEEEIHRLKSKWQTYLSGFDGDPYYNPNLCKNEPNFTIHT